MKKKHFIGKPLIGWPEKVDHYTDYFKVLESMRFFKLPHSCLMLYLFIFLSFYLFIFLSFYLFISNVFSSSYHTDNGQFTAMNFATTEPPLTVLDNSASINASKTFISP
ncbi:MAG: hypothetical protein ACI8VC_002710 [Candidatus Endobugula sp.]|jgi:hypothetical protein